MPCCDLNHSLGDEVLDYQILLAVNFWAKSEARTPLGACTRTMNGCRDCAAVRLYMSSCRCGSCSKSFNGQVALHFPGLDGLKKPIVWVFPEVLVCLNCGIAEFAVPDEQLKTLRNPESSDHSKGVAV